MRRNVDAIVLENVGKAYGDTRALDGVSLTVPAGSVLALLGHNGAGKTTMVRILTTLERPDSGHASVLDFDVVRQARAVRAVISAVGQQTTVEHLLTARENLTHLARLWGFGPASARRRVDELIDAVDLRDAADRRVSGYSGGMRRRLDLACSLVSRPSVLFLDEPTVGLDPVSRRQIWNIIAGRVDDGATVLLTTQQLDEADRISDQVCVLDHGRIVRTGTPDDMQAALPGDRIEVVVADPSAVDSAGTVLAKLTGRSPDPSPEASRVSLTAPNGARLTPEIVRALESGGIEVEEITIRRPTLEDAFLAIAGGAR